MNARVDRFRDFAAICAAVDYASPRSIGQYNRASDEMRCLVAEAYHAGPDAVAELFPLLEEPLTNHWLAFQLLDLGQPPAAIVEQCLTMIRNIATSQRPTDAMGATLWLQEWENRHSTSIT